MSKRNRPPKHVHKNAYENFSQAGVAKTKDDARAPQEIQKAVDALAERIRSEDEEKRQARYRAEARKAQRKDGKGRAPRKQVQVVSSLYASDSSSKRGNGSSGSEDIMHFASPRSGLDGARSESGNEAREERSGCSCPAPEASAAGPDRLAPDRTPKEILEHGLSVTMEELEDPFESYYAQKRMAASIHARESRETALSMLRSGVAGIDASFSKTILAKSLVWVYRDIAGNGFMAKEDIEAVFHLGDAGHMIASVLDKCRTNPSERAFVEELESRASYFGSTECDSVNKRDEIFAALRKFRDPAARLMGINDMCRLIADADSREMALKELRDFSIQIRPHESESISAQCVGRVYYGVAGFGYLGKEDVREIRRLNQFGVAVGAYQRCYHDSGEAGIIIELDKELGL